MENGGWVACAGTGAWWDCFPPTTSRSLGKISSRSVAPQAQWFKLLLLPSPIPLPPPKSKRPSFGNPSRPTRRPLRQLSLPEAQPRHPHSRAPSPKPRLEMGVCPARQNLYVPRRVRSNIKALHLGLRRRAHGRRLVRSLHDLLRSRVMHQRRCHPRRYHLRMMYSDLALRRVVRRHVHVKILSSSCLPSHLLSPRAQGHRRVPPLPLYHKNQTTLSHQPR